MLIITTSWHKQYEDGDCFAYCQGFVPSAGDWMVAKGVKVVGHDTRANDPPLATAIGPQRNGPLLPHLEKEWFDRTGGRDWKADFPAWEPVRQILFRNGILGIENVRGDLDAETGKRCTFAFFSSNWDRGDGCIIRLAAGGLRAPRTPAPKGGTPPFGNPVDISEKMKEGRHESDAV